MLDLLYTDAAADSPASAPAPAEKTPQQQLERRENSWRSWDSA
jgi:hypothetical protein